jgi:hypothetical protein
MSRAGAIGLAAVLAAAVVATATPARSTSRGVICGQLQGPPAAFWSNVTNLHLKGTTWTVLASGVPCAQAMKATPGLLTQWAKAKIGAPLTFTGARCLKMTDRAYSGAGVSSGGFVCTTGPGTPAIFGPKTFSARMTDGWTTQQIKQYLGLG